MISAIEEGRRTYVMRGPAKSRALDVYHLIFAPTHACNLRCRHCYLPDHLGHVMPLENVELLIADWEKIVVRDRGRLGGYFHLKGGEPLIVPYFAEVLDLLADRGSLRFMMTTNGTFLRERDLRSFRRLNAAIDGEAIVIVSLDGSCEEVHRVLRGPDQFAKTVNFAQAMVESGINLHFNYVVHSGNIDDVPRFVEFAEGLGATQVNFLPMVPKGYGLELGDAGRPDAEKLHRLLTDLYCRGDQRRKELLAGNYAHILDLERRGVSSSCECVAGYKGLFYITPEGNAYSCPNLVNPDLTLGNFLKTSLIEIHDKAIDRLYESRIASEAVDDRYLCRGERLVKPAAPVKAGVMGLSLPVLGQTVSCGDVYPDPIGRLQDILVDEGLASRESGRGMSYCFSRNF